LFKLRETWEYKVVEDEEADEVANAIPENRSTKVIPNIINPCFLPIPSPFILINLQNLLKTYGCETEKFLYPRINVYRNLSHWLRTQFTGM